MSPETLMDVVKALWLVAAVLVLFVFVRGVIRFWKAPRAAKKNYWLMFKIWAGWRKLTLNLDLAQVVKETTTVSTRDAIGPRLFETRVGKERTHKKIRYPRVKMQADEYGVILSVRTIPKVGREEFEKAARFLADAWGCAKVQVSQPKPGRLTVRALKHDPLASPLGMTDAPAEVYDATNRFKAAS